VDHEGFYVWEDTFRVPENGGECGVPHAFVFRWDFCFSSETGGGGVSGVAALCSHEKKFDVAVDLSGVWVSFSRVRRCTLMCRYIVYVQ